MYFTCKSALSSDGVILSQDTYKYIYKYRHQVGKDDLGTFYLKYMLRDLKSIAIYRSRSVMR